MTKSSPIIPILALISDLISVFVFLVGLVTGNISPDLDTTFPYIFWFVIVLAAAMWYFKYTDTSKNQAFIHMISFLYYVMGALFYIVVVYRITDNSVFLQTVGYITLIWLIVVMGMVVGDIEGTYQKQRVLNAKTFQLANLLHIFWVFWLFISSGLSSNVLGYNILLFISMMPMNIVLMRDAY